MTLSPIPLAAQGGGADGGTDGGVLACSPPPSAPVAVDGRALWRARVQARRTQTSIADAVACTAGYLSKIETRGRVISARLFVALATELGVADRRTLLADPAADRRWDPVEDVSEASA